MPAAFGREASGSVRRRAAGAGQFTAAAVTARLRDGVSIEDGRSEVEISGRQLRGVEPEPGAPPRFTIVRELDELTARRRARAARAHRVGGRLAAIVCAERREPAARARHRAPRGDRRAPRARRDTRADRAPGARRKRIARRVRGRRRAGARATAPSRCSRRSAAAQLPGGSRARSESCRASRESRSIRPCWCSSLRCRSRARRCSACSPALRLARFGEALSHGAHGERDVCGSRARDVQLALATMLLIGAGLLLHSFAKLVAVDLGSMRATCSPSSSSCPATTRPTESSRRPRSSWRGCAAIRKWRASGYTDIAPLTPGIALGGGLLPVGSSAGGCPREEASLPVGQRTQTALRRRGLSARAGRAAPPAAGGSMRTAATRLGHGRARDSAVRTSATFRAATPSARDSKPPSAC